MTTTTVLRARATVTGTSATFLTPAPFLPHMSVRAAARSR